MTWQFIPIAAAISLVFGATRYEETPAILATAGRTFVQIAVLFGIVLAMLFVLSYRL